ncbi:M48 family metalloprotease [Pelagibacterium limicola]|uniref:M48 family metalloprotease n=1 Tax=Pelagibacterium limicola TaxID=2791022 RepID=UPI0018AFE6FB|nr:M48 family metalloprotease [Pelagibacterium limicola]
MAWQMRIAAFLVAFGIAASSVAPAYAQSIRIIRDAEIEAMVAAFATPLFRAAGFARDPRIVIVNDRRFNAFVTEDGNIYINHGTILDVETPGALKAILAHEIGHLAGGHIARLREQMNLRGQLQVLSMILGVGAVAASAGTSAAGEVSQMASAFLMASSAAAHNSLMAYRQSEESAADAAALRLLERTGQSPRGLVDTLRLLLESQVQRAGAQNYMSTHPLAQDRLNQVESQARQSAHWGAADSAADVRALAMAKAKIIGFLEPNTVTANAYPNSDRSLAARYARAIAAYRAGGGVSAVQIMPTLISEQPSNPFLHELYGQMLFELGQPAQAIAPLKRAVDLAPDQPLIRILYAQALVAAGGAANLNEAVLQLKRSQAAEPLNVRLFTVMSQAYNGLGQPGHATLAAAEAAIARRELPTARGLARQAQQQLTQGSPEWLRAGDILGMQ